MPKYNSYLIRPEVKEKTNATNWDGKRKHGVEENGCHHKILNVGELIS